MRWYHELVLGLIIVFGFQAVQFGVKEAPTAVLRKVFLIVHRIRSFFVSSADKAWVTPGAEPPSGRLTALMNMFAGLRTFELPDCKKTGVFSSSDLKGLRSMSSIPGKVLLGLAPDGTTRPADEYGEGSLWVDKSFEDWDPSNPVILFVHGGGNVIQTVNDYLGFSYALALRSGIRVLSWSYPKAPEVTADVQGKMLASVVDRLLEYEKNQFRKVVLVSVSGGGVSALESLFVSRLSASKPTAAVFLSPMLGPKVVEQNLANAQNDFLDPEFIACALRASYDIKGGKYVHPVELPDWKGLPPLYFQYSPVEFLAHDSKTAIAAAQERGADVEVDVIPSSPHGCACVPSLATECDDALTRVCEWIKSKVSIKNFAL